MLSLLKQHTLSVSIDPHQEYCCGRGSSGKSRHQLPSDGAEDISLRGDNTNNMDSSTVAKAEAGLEIDTTIEHHVDAGLCIVFDLASAILVGRFKLYRIANFLLAPPFTIFERNRSVPNHPEHSSERPG